MEFFLEKIEGTKVKIGEHEYPILYSMKAAALMEKRIGKPLRDIMNEYFGVDNDAAPMSFTDQVIVLQCLMEAAGVEGVDLDALMGSLSMADRAQIGNACITEILSKSPRAKGKNAAAADKKKG